MSRIRVTRYCECPFSAALELAEKVISARSELYLTPLPPLGEQAAFTSKATDDSTDESRKHSAMLIAWRPRTRSMFPEFRGVLTVRPHYRGAMLRLNGQYEPPFGFAGKVFDGIAGGFIARRTLGHLMDELAGDIEAAYAQERRHKTA
jgi:hypothetical protein